MFGHFQQLHRAREIPTHSQDVTIKHFARVEVFDIIARHSAIIPSILTASSSECEVAPVILTLMQDVHVVHDP
jgi:hypothetical protein